MFKKRVPDDFYIKFINSDKISYDCKDKKSDKNKCLLYYSYLKRNNLEIPFEVKKFYKRNLISNILLLDYKNHLEDLLNKNDIKFFFYKGIYLLENIYDDIGIRYLGDIDILIDKNDLHKLKEIFPNFSKTIDELIKDKYFHERYIPATYKNQKINIDIHKNIVSLNKYPVNPEIFFKENRNELQLLILLLEINSEFFNDDKRIIDVLFFSKKIKIDWDYFYSIVYEFKLEKVVYTTFAYINKYFEKNFPLKENFYCDFIYKNIFTFKNKRKNQFFLFFYNFNNLGEFLKFLKSRIRYSLEKKELKEEIKKFWIEYE